jgi:hypothetical protein
MNEDILKTEQQFIYLLLHDKNLVGEWLDSSLSIKHFHHEFHFVLNCIVDCYDKDVLLTRKTFISFIKKINVPKDQLEQEIVFNKCYMSKTNLNDFPMLITLILDNFLSRNSTECIRRFSNNKNKKGNTFAVKELISNLQDLSLDNLVGDKIIYDDIRNIAPQYLEEIKKIKSGEIKQKDKIICGIKEIDETMVTGFLPGTLTLFCADIASYKSAIMLNVGLNIWKRGYNVLFVPIEMATQKTLYRALARESKVPTEKIFNPQLLSDEEVKKLEDIKKEWQNSKSLFYILEIPHRTTISSIRRQIDRHLEIFRPSVVVIDYTDNLEPEKDRYGRNDLEVRDMLQEIRMMGRYMDFAIVSAVQLGKDALKKIRKYNFSKNKSDIHSEDIRGPHTSAMYADNIYAQIVNNSQANPLLDLFVIKARDGKNIFPNGKTKATLSIAPEIGLIFSQDDYIVPDEEKLEGMFEKNEQDDFDEDIQIKNNDVDELFDEENNEQQNNTNNNENDNQDPLDDF